jgi:hypothetical protein
VYAADEEKRPVYGEADDVTGVVEVVRACGADWERPVEGGKAGGLIPCGRGRVDALNKAGAMLARGFDSNGMEYCVYLMVACFWHYRSIKRAEQRTWIIEPTRTMLAVRHVTSMLE